MLGEVVEFSFLKLQTKSTNKVSMNSNLDSNFFIYKMKGLEGMISLGSPPNPNILKVCNLK